MTLSQSNSQEPSESEPRSTKFNQVGKSTHELRTSSWARSESRRASLVVCHFGDTLTTHDPPRNPLLLRRLRLRTLQNPKITFELLSFEMEDEMQSLEGALWCQALLLRTC